MTKEEILNKLKAVCDEHMKATVNHNNDDFYKGWYAAYMNMSNLIKDIEKDI